jgi:hypothetical protein
MNTQCEVRTKQAATAEAGPTEFVNAARVHNALTARLEKRLWTWMRRECRMRSVRTT